MAVKNSVGLDEDVYAAGLQINRSYLNTGGQALIAHEIIAVCGSCQRIVLPFVGDGLLEAMMRARGLYVESLNYRYPYGDSEMYVNTPIDIGAQVSLQLPTMGEVVYMGTPTIVDDKPLFDVPMAYAWNKRTERIVVRQMVENARAMRYRRLITGLGSGDISVEERISDMGGSDVAQVVAYKRFSNFEDWVICRNL